MLNPIENSEYEGKRALMLLRVSTPEQEKGFGWPAQEKEIRKKLIEPIGLKLDEDRHIIRDTYTGLEFRDRPALQQILEMARRGEFDILTTDVLDRLGRKGLQRELYRMQLKELGVRILTTDPNDHADDDSLIGEMIRLIKGYQSEEELNNIKRRTMNGRRVKIEGNKEKGVEPQIGGNGHRYYGYSYILDDRGKRVGVALNLDVIKEDEDGTIWTEVKVVEYVFESAANGIALRQIAKVLNDKGIPAPYAAKSIKSKKMRHPLWQASSLSRMTRNSIYYGEARFFKVRTHKNVQGKKEVRERNDEKDQLVINVPAIVTKELADLARKKVTQNKQFATRNNSSPETSLLRAGFAKCGHCGGSLRVSPHSYRRQDGSVNEYLLYTCGLQAALLGVCKGCSILTTTLDNAAWQKAIEIIRDPLQIDAKINAFRAEDPTATRRKTINKKLKEIREQQLAMRQNLASLMMTQHPDRGTMDFLNTQLQQFADQEEGYTRELASDEYEYEKWKIIEEKLNELHKKCADIREKLDDPDYNISYKDKRDILSFLGIQAIIWKKGHSPQFEIRCNPSDIVDPLFLMVPRPRVRLVRGPR